MIKMNSIVIVIKELIENRKMIFNLAKYELRMMYAGNTLGGLWLFLNPLIQITLFWVVFGAGIRGGGPVGDTPFIVWLLAGLIPWFNISACFSSGANSISSKLVVASKMNFPLSIVPIYTILSQLAIHGILLIFVFLSLVIFNVGFDGLNIIRLIYIVPTTTIFLISLAYITSTAVSVFKDFNLLISHLTRLFMWLTPIMWLPLNMTRGIRIMIRVNPIHYMINGYRNAFLYGNVAVEPPNGLDTIYFWLLVIFMLFLGTKIHVKFRREFIDYL